MKGRRWQHDGGAEELRILEAQLDRMRGMLGAYSGLFFRQITIWGVISLLLLALSGLSTGAPVGVLLLFVVPFAFLEAGYTFYYTVFARRHAEFLERTINARLGRDVLAAHQLEAAYFYEPDAPKLSFLSFGRLSGYGSVMTIGYSAAALLLWGQGSTRGSPRWRLAACTLACWLLGCSGRSASPSICSGTSSPAVTRSASWPPYGSPTQMR